eukprot:GHVR01163976.1.p1 GENE.GHVR01163976.1~~GHVR01163976.1.p1  ORF type:complete len:381 (+),score=26.84 GHVR01163976.1:109-1251(+)
MDLHKDFQPSTTREDNFMIKTYHRLVKEETLLRGLNSELGRLILNYLKLNISSVEHQYILEISEEVTKLEDSKRLLISLIMEENYLRGIIVNKKFTMIFYLFFFFPKGDVCREHISNMMKLSSITPSLLKTELIKTSISMFCQPDSSAMVLLDKMFSNWQLLYCELNTVKIQNKDKHGNVILIIPPSQKEIKESMYRVERHIKDEKLLQRQNKDRNKEKHLPPSQKEVGRYTPNSPQKLMSPSPYVQEKMCHTSYRVVNMCEDSCLVHGYNLCDAQSIMNFKFTHHPIHFKFSNFFIDTFNDLFCGVLKPKDLPPIEVMEYEGTHSVVKGNRRLLLYKKLLESKDKHMIMFPVLKMDFDKEIFREKKKKKLTVKRLTFAR